VRLTLLIFTLAWLALPALAGAWSRDPGKGFVSASHSYSLTYSSPYPSIYAEFGLRPSLTLGFEAGGTGDTRTASLFLRRHFGRADARSVWAGEVALGAAEGLDAPFIHVGVLWGRGFSSGMGPGWFDSRLVVRRQLNAAPWSAKLDAMVGVKSPRDINFMLELSAEATHSGADTIHLGSSIALPLGAGKRLQIGLSKGAFNTQEEKIKVSFWAEF